MRSKLYSTKNKKERSAAQKRADRMRYRLQQFETCYEFNAEEYAEWIAAFRAMERLSIKLSR